MAKRFKLRICRVITTTLQSCRSKDPSNLPQDPAALSSFNPTFSAVQQNHHHRPSFKRQVSSALVSMGCGLPSGEEDRISRSPPEEFKWRKEEKWHVVAKIYEHPNYTPRRKIYNSSASCDDSDSDDLTFAPPARAATPPPCCAEGKKRRGKKKKSNIPTRIRISTSSADSGWFSSEGGGAGDERDEEETETLVSSSISCLSTDSSSDFNSHHYTQQLQPIRETQPFTTTSLTHHRKTHHHNNNKRRPSNKRPKRGSLLKPIPPAPQTAAEAEIPARLSMFKKLIPCTVEGKVKESFAVVKRSADPYEDFKNSMMDMIVEKQMFEAKDLEQLLQCFLSLNSRHYHGIIVEAFSEIWEAIFSHANAGGSQLPASGDHQCLRRRQSRRLVSF